MTKSTDFIPQFQAVFSQMHGDLPQAEYQKVRQFILEEIARQDGYARLIHIKLSVKES